MFNPLMSDGNNPLNSTDKPCLSGGSGSIETGAESLFQTLGKSLSTGVSQQPIEISPLAGGNSDNFILPASHVLLESALVEQALESAKDVLTGFGEEPDFTNKMNIAFGNSWDAEVASNLFKDSVTGNFSELPNIEIRAGSEINEANGAFAAANDTIYLSSDFLAKNAGNTEAVTSVLLEEIGHSIDSKINVLDAAGDEGDIFARVVQGKAISADELLGLKAEDDTATIAIGGKDISIEMSQIAMTSIGDKVYQSHRGRDNKIYTRFSTGFSSDGQEVTWSDWKATTSGTTYSAPSLETFNGKLYQSTRGTDDKIYTRFSNSISPDAIEWSPWVAAEAPARTKNAIALEAFNGKLYQSHRGVDNKIYTRSTSDGVTWSGWTATTSGTTYSAPSLEAVGDNKLYQSSRGTDDKIYTRSSSDGVNWSQWTATTSGTTYSTPDLEEFKGKLYQSTRGTDDKIYTRFSADGINWNQWKESGGETPTAPTLEAVGDKLFQSHQGLDQKIYTRFSSSVAPNGEITWTPWKESGGYSPLDRDDFSVIPTGEFNAEYYNNNSLSGAPTVITKESKIEKNWGTGGPGKSIANDNFSVRWTGKFNFDQSNYAFKVKGNDGVRMWVDNKLVIDQWKDQPTTEYSANVDLTKGSHEVKVEYYEKEKGAEVKAWWEKAGGTPNPNYIYKQADYLNTLYQDNTNNVMKRTDHDGTSAFDSVDGDSDKRVYALVGGEVIEAKNGKQFPTANRNNWVYNGTVAVYNKELNKTFIYWHFAEGSINESLQGKTIAPGSVIGREGSTGYSTGIHTHVQVHAGRVNVDMSNPNAPIAPAPSSRLNVASVFQEGVRKGLVELYQ